MSALIFILISLTAAVFHGVAPVRAEDVTTPTPIEINGDTATVEVKLYTDENHTQELNGAVTSTSKLYGAFSAQFKSGEAPSPENYIAVYELPGTIVVDDNAGGNLMEGRRRPLTRLARGKSRTIRSSLRLIRAGLTKTLRKFLSEPIFHLS